ncbi:MAG TPA: sigma factor-like helix-turn-helix DNA-binding protein [Chitinophagaceae bacterium]|nr:sigma factor-like helix-turn-helix DNA-binding protein [Chitinophagaceae bacterium]
MSKKNKYYLLTSTANKIWRDNDLKEQQQMYVNFVKEYKDLFFRQVITNHSKIPAYILAEIAENALLMSWEMFTNAGIEKKITIKSAEYSGYLFIIFKRTYFKLLTKEIRHSESADEFAQSENNDFVTLIEPEVGSPFSIIVQRILDSMSPVDKQLMIWRYVDELTIDDITERKSISRNSIIKELSRAKKKFTDLYNELNNR